MSTEVFDLKEWFAENVLKGQDIPEEEAKALFKTLERDTIRKNIGNSTLRQSDYSRTMDGLKVREDKISATETSIEEKRVEADVFIQRQKDRDHNNEKLFEQMQLDLAESARLLEKLGETPPKRTPPKVETEPVKEYATIDDLDARDATRDQDSVAYLNKVTNLANRFHKDFDEYLDPDVLVEHATKKELTLDGAYDDLYKERYATKSEEAVQERIKVAVEEARVEERSRTGVPLVEEGPTRPHVFDVPPEERLVTEDSRVGAATAALKQIRSGKRELGSVSL